MLAEASERAQAQRPPAVRPLRGGGPARDRSRAQAAATQGPAAGVGVWQAQASPCGLSQLVRPTSGHAAFLGRRTSRLAASLGSTTDSQLAAGREQTTNGDDLDGELHPRNKGSTGPARPAAVHSRVREEQDPRPPCLAVPTRPRKRAGTRSPNQASWAAVRRRVRRRGIRF
jgi:hypothetical protein